MDIYEAIRKIEAFLETYPGEHGDDPAPWAPTETKILPSGDDKDTIKIWFNFGPDVDEAHVKPLLEQFEKDVAAAHDGLGAYTLHIRGDAM